MCVSSDKWHECFALAYTAPHPPPHILRNKVRVKWMNTVWFFFVCFFYTVSSLVFWIGGGHFRQWSNLRAEMSFEYCPVDLVLVWVLWEKGLLIMWKFLSRNWQEWAVKAVWMESWTGLESSVVLFPISVCIQSMLMGARGDTSTYICSGKYVGSQTQCRPESLCIKL